MRETYTIIIFLVYIVYVFLLHKTYCFLYMKTILRSILLDLRFFHTSSLIVIIKRLYFQGFPHFLRKFFQFF